MIDRTAMLPSIPTAPVLQKTAPLSGTELSGKFGEFLNEAMTKLSAQQAESQKLTEQFIKGETGDVHQVMVAAEKVSLALEMTVQTRNKMIEAYQEIMRMQL